MPIRIEVAAYLRVKQSMADWVVAGAMFLANFWTNFWANFWADFWADFRADFWADFWLILQNSFLCEDTFLV